ncbi:hypothetical protein COU15_01690 [Candidatus Kaiserbacteria bacterium CG10_big_fil_rev_8_21_14_0_10_45_20]|uniref:Alternative oxidase n=1 Tax=Candidatus Kaiserbacteria bacterium CG10_big_fil_rev_8_21_14_0_10_45_20 TaxID=1974607 RepID=A0A2H0UHG5_9BACT|nr:MAG: hypothetical protein COU15_01690 [Candidatus Kaiserbacteria bacterium CG10_big_fil_rev_8_21_14_0_10_45_20]
MEMQKGDAGAELLNKELENPETLKAYKETFDDYKPSFFPRLFGGFLVWSGNLVYGKKPSYLKFRAVEVIARVPYHSWTSSAYTLLTLFYTNEKKAMQLADTAEFARFAQDNETMHVVVISCLAKSEESAGFFRHTLIPVLFSFFYFWVSYWLYLINPKYSFELNYLFEDHAFEQYSLFLEEQGEELKKKPFRSDFLDWYGRFPRSQYEFFVSVRNDELIHRNTSIREISKKLPDPI